MNKNSLECDSNDLHDAIDDVDTAGDGGVNVEDTNSDCEAAVDVDEEDTKVEKKHINADSILQGSVLIFICQLLNLKKSHHGCKDCQKVDESIQNFAQIFKNWSSFKMIGAEEHDEVKEDQKQNQTSESSSYCRV